MRVLRKVYPKWLPGELFLPLVLLFCMLAFEAVSATIFGYLSMRRWMVWNIFLAGLPFLFACGAVYFEQKQGKKLRFLSIVFWPLWLLFFPNAPYMLTDLIHLRWYDWYISGVGFTDSPRAWFGLLHIFVGVAAGTIVGMLSLRLLHDMVTRRLGRLAGWCFAGGTCLLGGFGVWIGRCLRFNSWDVFHRPFWLVGETLSQLGVRAGKTILIFAAMTAVAYLLLCVFTLQGKAEADR